MSEEAKMAYQAANNFPSLSDEVVELDHVLTGLKGSGMLLDSPHMPFIRVQTPNAQVESLRRRVGEEILEMAQIVEDSKQLIMDRDPLHVPQAQFDHDLVASGAVHYEWSPYRDQFVAPELVGIKDQKHLELLAGSLPPGNSPMALQTYQRKLQLAAMLIGTTLEEDGLRRLNNPREALAALSRGDNGILDNAVIRGVYPALHDYLHNLRQFGREVPEDLRRGLDRMFGGIGDYQKIYEEDQGEKAQPMGDQMAKLQQTAAGSMQATLQGLR